MPVTCRFSSTRSTECTDEQTRIFGDLNADVRGQRIFTIGLGLGLILGALCPWEPLRVVLVLFGVFIVTVRTLAQIHWPDRMPDDNPVDRK